jgi:uncharacterized membrane protein
MNDSPKIVWDIVCTIVWIVLVAFLVVSISVHAQEIRKVNDLLTEANRTLNSIEWHAKEDSK